MSGLNDAQLRELLEFRTALRRYLHWSEQHAVAAGLTPARHQLLLAIAGHDDPAGPTITQIAEYLLLRHHSAVGLIDRAAESGLVERVPDPEHYRLVRVRLTPIGHERLGAMAPLHEEELTRLGQYLKPLGEALPQSGLAAEPAPSPPPPPRGPHPPPPPPAVARPATPRPRTPR